MSNIQIFTIGFTKKSAEEFFTKLCNEDVQRIVDIRLNNTSQLAGFTKKDNLCYFLKVICHIDYVHMLDLAPTQDILDEYKKHKGDWSVYENKFLKLIAEREIEKQDIKSILDRGCLLCSEDTPDHCHRRLVAEYLRDKWGNVEITHII